MYNAVISHFFLLGKSILLLLDIPIVRLGNDSNLKHRTEENYYFYLLPTIKSDKLPTSCNTLRVFTDAIKNLMNIYRRTYYIIGIYFFNIFSNLP